MTKKDMLSWVKRKLGYPMVRVELHNTQIEQHIDEAKDLFLKWASGNATVDQFFTLPISANCTEYDLPGGVTDVITVQSSGMGGGGINTLFSTSNVMYNSGMLSFIHNIGGYSMVDYHLALDHMETIQRYIPDKYNWWFNKSSNTLNIRPTPTEWEMLLIRCFMLKGTDENTIEVTDEHYDIIYDNEFVREYTLACSKETLGLIRRKFSNFGSIGNTGISLDGDSLISEGKQEKEKLLETLKTEQDYEGWPIYYS